MPLQALVVVMSASLLLFTEAIALSAQVFAEGREPISQVLFKPSRTGKPPTTRGAGSRNDRLCSQDAPTNPGDSSAKTLALTALVPSDQSGLTWAERPTFWVYLPKTSARQMVLSVKAAGNQPHFQSFLPITKEAGIVGIPLPTNSPPLEVGKSYQWAVVLLCGDRPNPNDPFVTAWVERVAPSPGISNSQDALATAASYGEQGIWYDALTNLAIAQQSEIDKLALTKIWIDFLAQPSVGLGAIAKEPLQPTSQRQFPTKTNGDQ
ncbi:DUF928 domain-containing protein [Desmonostoc muscorum]|uniref:DUF928 domain-containing protein n=1 Tax=Desmonostoc muscorum LEGE 12446 TaxID=1828758 RepID=A0A8J6ZQN6_DESMC|nr:DUF928 domain-containing protein [Desmonostoc muscorum]